MSEENKIAEDFRGTDALTLVKRLVAAEERLDSMAHEPFNTPEELMQDLIRENSEFTKTIVRLRERERVLREALEEIRELAMTFALVGNESQRALSESVIGILRRAALATPAAEQPAQPKKENAK